MGWALAGTIIATKNEMSPSIRPAIVIFSFLFLLAPRADAQRRVKSSKNTNRQAKIAFKAKQKKTMALRKRGTPKGLQRLAKKRVTQKQVTEKQAGKKYLAKSSVVVSLKSTPLGKLWAKRATKKRLFSEYAEKIMWNRPVANQLGRMNALIADGGKLVELEAGYSVTHKGVTRGVIEASGGWGMAVPTAFTTRNGVTNNTYIYKGELATATQYRIGNKIPKTIRNLVRDRARVSRSRIHQIKKGDWVTEFKNVERHVLMVNRSGPASFGRTSAQADFTAYF